MVLLLNVPNSVTSDSLIMLTYSTISKRPKLPRPLNLRRCWSSQISYNDKVFAIPFAFDKYHAIQETCFHALNLTTPLDLSFSDQFKRFLTVFKNIEGGLRPLRIQPLYFPTWRVEAEALHGRTGMEDNTQNIDPVKSAAYLPSGNLYHPGHHMMPLATLSFAPFPDSPILHWHKSMSRLSDGTDIVCLPYTLSPLEFANTLKDNFIRARTLDNEKSELLSLHIGPIYPILFPLFLVQYDVPPSKAGDKPEPLTIVIEGHRLDGALFAENVGGPYLHPSIKLLGASTILSPLQRKIDIPLEITSKGKVSSFISVYRRNPPDSAWKYTNYLSNSPSQSLQLRHRIINAWQVSQHSIDWNDIRIQSPTIHNRIWIEAFLSMKLVLSRQRMGELQQQPAIQSGDLAALHTFLCAGLDTVPGGEEASWYYESLRKHTTVIKR